jgi:competence protein ComEA
VRNNDLIEESTMGRYRQDLNTATKQELARIPGITDEVAEAIVQYRKSRGSIQTFDELVDVHGITRSHINHLKPWLRIGG